MKKNYIKPKVKAEKFEISDFIAANCRIDVGFGDTGASRMCAFPDPDFGGALMLFNSPGVCEEIWDAHIKGCYHIPDGGHGYFGS